MAEYAKFSKVSPQWEKFASDYPEVDSISKVGAADRRRILDELVARAPASTVPEDVDINSVTTTTFTVKARDGYDIPVRSYVPQDATSKPHPLLVYIHGGGFMFGDLESGDFNCRVLSARLNLSVLNVDHRLAPKWPFPYGVNDAYDAVEWAASNAGVHLAADLSAGFLVGGISSGANFAGVIAYTARDRGLTPAITGVFLSIPVALWPSAYHLIPPDWKDQLLSIEQNKDAPILTPQGLALIQESYQAPPEDVRLSFLLNDSHAGLPRRAYFQICGLDPLRDEGFLWEKLLQKHSGARSKVHVYSGLPHGFWRFTQIKASAEWLDDLSEGIHFLLRDEETKDKVPKTEVIIKGV
ncbi:putative Esterase/lipase/thioesterase [Seiridium cardinale]